MNNKSIFNPVRDQRIFNQLQQVRQQSSILVIDCEFQGLMREDFWVLWIKGRPNTEWQGMIIPVQITFPQNYPIKAPNVNFPKQFLHIHVYQGGKICMPILQPQYWKPKSSMIQLIKRIQSLIHQQINLYSPANNNLFSIYKNQNDQYKKLMQKQKLKYKTKDTKYYHMACVHIQLQYDNS